MKTFWKTEQILPKTENFFQNWAPKTAIYEISRHLKSLETCQKKPEISKSCWIWLLSKEFVSKYWFSLHLSLLDNKIPVWLYKMRIILMFHNLAHNIYRLCLIFWNVHFTPTGVSILPRSFRKFSIQSGMNISCHFVYHVVKDK